MKRPYLFAALLLCGCRIFASKGDYADYREVRLAPDSKARAVVVPEASMPQDARALMCEQLKSVGFSICLTICMHGRRRRAWRCILN